jgi:hypothetical protein
MLSFGGMKIPVYGNDGAMLYVGVKFDTCSSSFTLMGGGTIAGRIAGDALADGVSLLDGMSPCGATTHHILLLMKLLFVSSGRPAFTCACRQSELVSNACVCVCVCVCVCACVTLCVCVCE